jgi:transcriptional regulator with XRE-family HTH domain
MSDIKSNLRLEGAGQALQPLRTQREMSLRDLEDKLREVDKSQEWDRGRLSRYENNKLAMSSEVMASLADALDVPVDVFVLSCLEEVRKGLKNKEIGKLLRRIVEEPDGR